MQYLKHLVSLAALTLSLHATASTVVSTPQNNATVQTKFPIAATASSCNGKTVVSMGYSFDSSPDVLIVNGQALNAEASINAGNHTLRVKAWGAGTVCVDDINLTVVNPPPSLIPSNAISSGSLTGNPLWQCTHDSGTGGASTAVMSFPVTLGGYTDVQEYDVTTYSNYGGERCSINFGTDTTSHNFIYDVWVQVPTPALVGNLELDMNQVTANDETVIFAFQCSKWSGDWELSYVADKTYWTPSKIPCNVANWTANTWHHVQIYTSRDDSGNVTYHWVAFDGQVSTINTTVPEEESLKWAIGALVVNFQIDPAQATGAPIIVYARQLTIYRW